MATRAWRLPAPDILKNRALLTLLFGHFTNDLVGGFIPVLFPLLTTKFDINLSTVGLVSLAYSGMSSITQPFFGWLADRYGTRLIGGAIVWSAIAFAGIGFAPSFHLVVLLAALAGIGSGLFHPFGALNASVVIPPRQRNSAMSVYVSGGSIGFSLGPLIGVGLLALFGLHGTAIWVLPGIVMATFLLFQMRTIALPGSRGSSQPVVQSAPGSRRMLVILTLVMMIVSWNLSAVESFVPIWYKDLGYGSGFYGPLTTIIILGGVVGALIAGALADHVNRRRLVTITFILSIPALLLFAQFAGPVAFLTGFIVGMLVSCANPILVVIAQQAMSSRAGIASGILLGVGFFAGAVGVPVMGAVADATSMQTAMRLLTLVALAGIAVSLFLPSEERLHEMAEERERAREAAVDTARQASPQSLDAPELG